MQSVEPRAFRACVVLAVFAIGGVLTGCQPEPGPTGSPTAVASPSEAPTASSSPSPSASETAPPAEAFSVPAACELVYSAGMFATLETDVAPLNDPGTTFLSTEQVSAIEILQAAPETLRCSWGPPSERGIATNVTAVTAEQSTALAEALGSSGFSSEPFEGGTLHRIQQETINLDDQIVRLGETHYLRGGGWVSTRWINVLPDGYAEDIVVTLWG